MSIKITMAAKDHVKERGSTYFCVMNKTKEDRFNYFKQLYRNNKFDILFKEKEAVYWLKLRSIARKPLLIEFCKFSGIEYSAKEPLQHLVMSQVLVHEFSHVLGFAHTDFGVMKKKVDWKIIAGDYFDLEEFKNVNRNNFMYDLAQLESYINFLEDKIIFM